MSNKVKFTIRVEMTDRWVPPFLAMLKTMQHCGALGRSRTVGIYSDGDGDFRPKFKWSPALSSGAAPVLDNGTTIKFDAG